MNLEVFSSGGYPTQASTEATEDLGLYDDRRFKYMTVQRIDAIVHAALLMVERGALTEKRARAALTSREQVVFDRALDIAKNGNGKQSYWAKS